MANPPQSIGLKEAVSAPDRPARVRPLANRNFRLLWMGENFSLFGDAFYGIALPWLVFQMTGSALAFGTILMVGGIPRAVFTLLGGVITDRFSPRAVMIVSNLLRLAITVILTLLAAGQVMQLWMLYVIAFCFGTVDAFFHPAYRSMIPLIVDEEALQASNSLMLGASQLMQIAGPGVAGVIVRVVGVVLSFAFDAVTFLYTSIMLMLMRPVDVPKNKSGAQAAHKGGVLAEIGEMLAFVQRDKLLRSLILIIAAINLLFVGPLVVGTATLGKVRFAEGSAAFGAMLSAFSIGMLIGTFVAGSFQSRWSGVMSLLFVAAEGVFMIGVAYTNSLVTACALWTLIGFGAGFGNVNVITMTQKQVTKDMMGRFMSLVVLAEIGLTPISNLLAGVLASIDVTMMFVAAGVLLTIIALLAAVSPEFREDRT